MSVNKKNKNKIKITNPITQCFFSNLKQIIARVLNLKYITFKLFKLVWIDREKLILMNKLIHPAR